MSWLLPRPCSVGVPQIQTPFRESVWSAPALQSRRVPRAGSAGRLCVSVWCEWSERPPCEPVCRGETCDDRRVQSVSPLPSVSAWRESGKSLETAVFVCDIQPMKLSAEPPGDRLCNCECRGSPHRVLRTPPLRFSATDCRSV